MAATLLKASSKPVSVARLVMLIALAFSKALALSDNTKRSVVSPVSVTVRLPMVALSTSLSWALEAIATPAG